MQKIEIRLGVSISLLWTILLTISSVHIEGISRLKIILRVMISLMHLSSTKKCSEYVLKFVLWVTMPILSRSVLRLSIFLRTKSIIVCFLLSIYECTIGLWYFFKYFFGTYFIIDENLQLSFYQDEIVMLIFYKLFWFMFLYSF